MKLKIGIFLILVVASGAHRCCKHHKVRKEEEEYENLPKKFRELGLI